MSKRDDFMKAVTGILWPDGGEDVDPDIVGRIANVAENLFGEVVDCMEVTGTVDKVVMAPGKDIQVVISVSASHRNKLSLIEMDVSGVSIRSRQLEMDFEEKPAPSEDNPDQMLLGVTESAPSEDSTDEVVVDAETGEVVVEVEDDPEADEAEEQPTAAEAGDVF